MGTRQMDDTVSFDDHPRTFATCGIRTRSVTSSLSSARPRTAGNFKHIRVSAFIYTGDAPFRVPLVPPRAGEACGRPRPRGRPGCSCSNAPPGSLSLPPGRPSGGAEAVLPGLRDRPFASCPLELMLTPVTPPSLRSDGWLPLVSGASGDWLLLPWLSAVALSGFLRLVVWEVRRPQEDTDVSCGDGVSSSSAGPCSTSHPGFLPAPGTFY